jgi:thiamine-phosphate pyrophosphorylase
VDAGRLSPGVTAATFAEELFRGGARWVQYRNKTQHGNILLAEAVAIKRAAASYRDVRLIMNDRPDFAVAAGFDGVHLGQEDFSPRGARVVCKPPRIVGISTHNEAQVRAADVQPVDYIAIGPVYATKSKADPDPVVGLEGVKRARALTSKPLVAIGGVTLANCRDVIAAGADAVAVIAELLATPRMTTEEFLRILG